MFPKLFWLTVATCVTSLPTPAQPPLEKQNGPPQLSVRKRTKFHSEGVTLSGVVDEINEQRVRLRCQQSGCDASETTYELLPIKLLQDGKVEANAEGCEAYRWQDIKAGDSVCLSAVQDDGDRLTYCYRVCIRRRPGEKLPKSQDTKTKELYGYGRDSLLNDIENGSDVSDDEIRKQFPPQYTIDRNETPILVAPAGLQPTYQAKLNAIREKKAKESKDKDLKASPPPAEKK